MDTLGVLAHRGGLLVRHPGLSVGVVQAISRPSGLAIELLARRPVDHRTATERQRDIRRRVPDAPRQLLPQFDEGADLRVGWLDPLGHAHWEFATSTTNNSGDPDSAGPSSRVLFTLPPLFDEFSLVLAWPEIGFPETVTTLPLPSRTAVEQAVVSIWQAPLDVLPAPDLSCHRAGTINFEDIQIETGSVVAPPRVLQRGSHAAIALSRLTAVGGTLSLDLMSIAKDDQAAELTACMRNEPPRQDSPDAIRTAGPGAALAVIDGTDVVWIPSGNGSSAGGAGTFVSVREFTIERPAGGLLDLLLAWPAAQLPDVRVRIPLDNS
jgi:hypothetical protein